MARTVLEWIADQPTFPGISLVHSVSLVYATLNPFKGSSAGSSPPGMHQMCSNTHGGQRGATQWLVHNSTRASCACQACTCHLKIYKLMRAPAMFVSTPLWCAKIHKTYAPSHLQSVIQPSLCSRSSPFFNCFIFSCWIILSSITALKNYSSFLPACCGNGNRSPFILTEVPEMCCYDSDTSLSPEGPKLFFMAW